jgi:hypothetical protein
MIVSYFSEALRSLQQVVKIDAEGHVQAQPLRSRPRFPQPEHGISSTPDPVERDLSFREDLREFQSRSVAEKRHRACRLVTIRCASKRSRTGIIALLRNSSDEYCRTSQATLNFQ